MCMRTYVCLVVIIITPPENTTVSRGSDVTISCGYQRISASPVLWIINRTSFTQEELVNSPLYQLNNPTSPMTFSMTVFSINDTTTFQCVIVTPLTTSVQGTVTVINGTYVKINKKFETHFHNPSHYKCIYVHVFLFVRVCVCSRGYLKP